MAADDVAKVLEKLGIEGPVGAAGWSAGGRVALALAARRPEMVDRVVVMATPAPQEEVPWIPAEQQAMIEALKGKDANVVHEIMMRQFAQMVPKEGHEALALGLVGESEADKEALERPGVRERLREMIRAAFAQGATGIVQDIAGIRCSRGDLSRRM